MPKKLDAQKMSASITNSIKSACAKERLEETVISEDKRYMYFVDKQNTRYFYTIGKTIFSNKLEYVAGIMNYDVIKRQHIINSSAGFRHKDEAIAWAKKHYATNSK